MPSAPDPASPHLRAASELAAAQGGVVSRRQLYALGVTRWEVTGQVRGGRCQLVGDQSVCLHNAEISAHGLRWAAVFQGGPRACLDGTSALIAAGLQRFEEDTIRVSVPRGARTRRTSRFQIRQTRRWARADLARSGIPRTRPPVAAVRGGLWAKTDKQAAYIITLVVQQGMASPEQIGEALLRVRRHRRRGFLHVLLNDLLGGARSLGEQEFAEECRRRGLPPPERQVLRRDSRGRYYLDLSWPAARLVVEIDGIHHAWAENVVGDALRQNSIALQGDTVLRLPLLGLRLVPDEFFAQISVALARADSAAA